MKIILTILWIISLILPEFQARAMDRLSALSQIESSDNDHMVGRQKEVSRYQIMPVFWAQAREWAGNENAFRPTNPAVARSVVDWIMQDRCRTFKARYHRTPNDFEYYLLWHRPACYIGRPTPRPITSTEAGRARRFASLCQS